MRAKKGLATIEKVEKYIYLDTDSEEVSPPSSPAKSRRPVKKSSPTGDKTKPAKQLDRRIWSLAESDEENIDPANPRGLPKLSSAPNHGQPRQASESLHSDQLPRSSLAHSLFPSDKDEDAVPQLQPIGPTTATEALASLHRTDSPLENVLRKSSLQHDLHKRAERQAALSVRATPRVKHLGSDHTASSDQRASLPSEPPIYEPATNMANMIPGGAFVPPNQQRNLRACMVCSIVRTQAQFLNGGCPNCEDILEFIGNSDNVAECTSAVFEGLITVADTSKSWVARYQRLEGYVPGVYATQVEGILPEEMISAIEAAGINYVPRDGSEDQMIPKD